MRYRDPFLTGLVPAIGGGVALLAVIGGAWPVVVVCLLFVLAYKLMWASRLEVDADCVVIGYLPLRIAAVRVPRDVVRFDASRFSLTVSRLDGQILGTNRRTAQMYLTIFGDSRSPVSELRAFGISVLDGSRP